MRRLRRKPLRFLLVSLLLILIGSLGGLTYRAVRRDRAGRALIAAIKRQDSKGVLTALAQGADPDTKEQFLSHLSLRQIFVNLLHGRPATHTVGPSALTLAFRQDLANMLPEQQEQNLLIVQALLKHGAQVITDRVKSAPSLAWAERNLNQLSEGPPQEEGRSSRLDLLDAADTFRSILGKYGPSARAYAGRQPLPSLCGLSPNPFGAVSAEWSGRPSPLAFWNTA